MPLAAPGDGFLTRWSVHLTLFFFMFGMMLQQFIGQNMILYKLCTSQHPDDVCGDMSSHPKVQDEVQASASKYITLQMISLGLPSAFSTLILGAASDKHGRKKIMCLTSFGVTLFTLSVWFQSCLDEMSQLLLIFGGLASGVTGGIMSFIGTVTNYVTDVTPAEERTSTLSKVFPFMGLGAMAGTLSAGFLESAFGFQVVLALSFFFELVALMLVTFFVKDAPPNKTAGEKRGIVSEIASGAGVLFLDKQNRRRLLPLAFSDVMTMAFVMCEGGLMLLYTKRPPFNWSSNIFGFYAAAKQIADVLGQIFGTGMIIKLIGTQNSTKSDFTILQIGVTMKIIVALITAFSGSSFMLLMAIPFCLLAGPAQSAGGSVVSKIVSADKKGSYTAFASFITTLIAPMLSSLYNHIYSTSVSSGNPGLVFLIHSSTQLVVVMMLHLGKQGLEGENEGKQEEKKDN